jgi:transcription elongation factor Elf1
MTDPTTTCPLCGHENPEWAQAETFGAIEGQVFNQLRSCGKCETQFRRRVLPDGPTPWEVIQE